MHKWNNESEEWRLPSFLILTHQIRVSVYQLHLHSTRLIHWDSMVERKLYKTKLCMLYQRGRCSRQHCNFAHGEADLRRSFNGRQEHRGGRDLRERLDRMRSPLHSSPGRRDAKARFSSQGDSPPSLGKRFDRNHKKRKQLEGHTNYSGRMSDGIEDQVRDRRQTSSETKMRFDVQLREMHSEMKTLENHKRQLEIYLEDKVKEADSLTLKIRELEIQLSKEKEDSKRFATKIKKFVKAHNHQMRLQDELKRSHAQLQKLGEHLGLDAAGATGPGNEDDSKINTISNDITGGYATSPLNEGLFSSPHRKRSRITDANDAAFQVNLVGGRTDNGKLRVERASKQSGSNDRLNNSKKAEVSGDVYNGRNSFVYEDKSNRNASVDAVPADKHKTTETGLTLPSTGIAAHAMDEEVDVVEMNDKFQASHAATTAAESEVPSKTHLLPFHPPPLPPIPQNAYAQYKGDDETVDIDVIDEDTVEVDIV